MTGKWNVLPLTPQEQEIEQQLAGIYPKCPWVARLLVLRGMKTPDEVHAFMQPSLAHTHDPFLMTDMDKAVARLDRALGAKEKIMVYGDYDVDGTTAVALVYRYLQRYCSNLEFYIPTRDDDGYGISLQSIDYAQSIGVTLIIVLDTGIKANDEIAYAQQKGIDFIVCDHHVPDDVLPPAAAILNPKRTDDKYPYKDLSGCGVGFKFMQAFAQSNGLPRRDLDSLLDLVAVSIAADIVPITGENRVYALHGLRRLNTNPCLGLKSIIHLCNLSGKTLGISDIIFKIGPRINASGRMESGQESVELLVTNDPVKAKKIAARIDQHNRDRKELDKQITIEANQIIEAHRQSLDGRKPIVIHDPSWHKGIIGIVAARLAELYCRPSVVLTTNKEGIALGSSRSVKNFDIYTAIKSCRDLLTTFGGHTNAVGLSMPEQNIPEFRKRLTEYVEQHINDEQVTPSLDIDAEISFEQINNDMLKLMRYFNPFGPENKRPVFVTKGVRDAGSTKLVGRANEHLRIDMTDGTNILPINGIAFNQAEHFAAIKDGQPFSICYTIEEPRQRNPNSLQLNIKAIRFEN